MSGRSTQLVPGTVVSVVIDGVSRRGVVQPYKRQWSWPAFPIRLDVTGQWRLLGADEVTVIEQPQTA